ncbi:MAG: 4-hydroxy-tetrahydrodipicolinate synthase [Candidatus Eisenbacteria bacterium]|uniref:4-hydroxy-tetrahydrodipicolinate synthase n=1 Tax=Eiseniibacteriota bacterium TaxID=2212470 RepID=A0A7Y2EA67_UNCEI|nr:4-hydroxy-tetrahydrodipicolinate synthase [Candidatus Eisenbacteria bacterium]
MFEGVSVALVTPFKNNQLDEASLVRLVQFVLDQGVDGLVPTGCTGEAGALTLDERKRIWEICLREAKGRAFVVAGTGTNTTSSTIEVSRAAEQVGVDGCMLITPYYNKPSQEGVVAHYRAVADAVQRPIMVYNVPGRTGTNILPETVLQLAEHPRIVAIKEASGSVDQVTEILCGSDITVLSGDDSLTLPMLAAGAKGVVSVLGHLAGREIKAMGEAYHAGNVAEAAAIHRRLYPLTRSLFSETNPLPVKAVLAHLGVLENELRLPLVPAKEKTTKKVVAILEKANILTPLG